MADDGSDLPLEGLPLLEKALEVTGRLATREAIEENPEELEEEPDDDTSNEIEAPEESEAAKSAGIISYIPVSRLQPGIISRD